MLEVDQLYTVFQANKVSLAMRWVSRASDNVNFHSCPALSIPQHIAKLSLNQQRFVLTDQRHPNIPELDQFLLTIAIHDTAKHGQRVAL